MNTFSEILSTLSLDSLDLSSLKPSGCQIKASLMRERKSLIDFANMISPQANAFLEEMAERSHQLTLQRFGKIIQLYAPLYVSNECVDTCTYCGFSRENNIARLTLKPLEVLNEARFLSRGGFRHVLLVSGEDPRATPPELITAIIKLLHKEVPSISLELAPQTEETYREWIQAGAEGLVVYQETYQRVEYSQFHIAGKKKKFDWRLETPERAARAGMKRIGIGILLGLAPWQKDALALYEHAKYLLKKYWRCQITVSLPRIRPAAGSFTPPYTISDKEFAQLICALRLALPDVGIVLSTREKPELRDGLFRIGVTHASAGSRTEPGGYENPNQAEEQFEIEDQRSPQEVARAIRHLGYEPVWKDWEAVLND